MKMLRIKSSKDKEDVHKKYLQRAVDLAVESVKAGGGPFGAVIVKDGSIVAEAYNSVTLDNDPTAHAEVNCIRKACKALGTFDLSGCVLYASSEPCPMCLASVYWAHLSELYYANDKKVAADAGFDDDFIYREFALDASERKLYSRTFGIECADKPFRIWNEKDDRTEY